MQMTPQQKILLACVPIFVVAAIAIFMLYPEWQKFQPAPSGGTSQGGTQAPSQEEIDRILESLAPPADAPQPSQEEIDEILKSLAPPPNTPQPTQEEIDAILESLRPR